MKQERFVRMYLREKEREIEKLQNKNTVLSVRETHFREVMIATLKTEIDLLKHILEE